MRADICFCIAHYILYIFAHIFALNYLLVYILFKDAQENSAYMIDDVRTWTDMNIIIACVMFYWFINLQALYLSWRYSRHILPCVVCSMFYGLCYLALGLSNISGCEDRDMLSCNDVVLSNRIIDLSIVYLCWGMLALTLWVCLYIAACVGFNYGRRYYFTKNCLGECVMLFASYYIGGVIAFGFPLCLSCGDVDSVDYGNFVNGTEV